jgi:energy-coupling factor transporter ATP-binding protein EcfA2
MRLKSITYAEHEGGPQEWLLENLTLASRNLIVGKNATGKSRALNVIQGLARHLTGVLAPTLSGRWDCTFSHADHIFRYEVAMEDDEVSREKFTRDKDVLLDRGEDGEGTIWMEELDGGKELRFQTPQPQLAALARRDKIQHKFLEPLFEWASSVRHVAFGSAMGKPNLAIFVPLAGAKPDDRETNSVAAMFRQGEKEFGKGFVEALMKDMAAIDYVVSEVGVQTPISIRFQGGIPTALPVGLYVKETDLPGITDQVSMSQGMFRAITLLVYMNYFALKKSAGCLLIDDIGEGLDFDRSCRLIDLLREKAESTKIQVVFATNDRFVMNRVPLEEWSVLQRRRNRVTVLNYANSKELFEEFKFTGLSNFSFLEMDFASQPTEKAKH